MLLERTLADLAASTMVELFALTERVDPLLRPTADAKFGDFQLNGAMALGKKLGRPPRELATALAEALAKHAAIEKAEVAGPGFVNLTLAPAWLGDVLTDALAGGTLGVPPVERPERIVVDYSGPNIAKQMHVGHLRSTIIGHAVVSLLRHVGHEVIGDNHLGDWGTQFGLLIVGMREFGDEAALESDAIVELERVYKASSARAKEDEAFAAAARAELAKLQSGDADNHRLWERFVATTRATLERVYARLDVSFDEWLGESAYHDLCAPVVEELLSRGLAREDHGAICVFWNELAEDPRYADRVPKSLAKLKDAQSGAPVPFIIRKGDGAFLYSTTDLATVKYRIERFRTERSVYVVGAPQALHFEQLFCLAELLGQSMRFDHVAFGSVLGEDGKILRTRAGKAVTLESLLDEAEERARARIEEARESGMLRITEEDLAHAARLIGIGSVKWADLSQNRGSDYRFDPDKMISFKGNAAPYVQYSYARVRSLFDRAEQSFSDFRAPISLTAPEELELGRTLARYPDVLHRAAEQYLPHLLCDQLFATATAFSRFYTEVNVLKAEPAERDSRLALAALAGKQLEQGLRLLGIGVLERM